MTFGRWVLGAVAGGLALGAVGAQAAPMPVVTAEVHSSVQTVQFYYDDPPPVIYESPRRYYYDDPPPRRYYDPPPRAYYEGPRRDWDQPRRYARPPGPGYTVPTVPGRSGRPGEAVIYDKEAAKDYMKDYRRAQKEIYKEKSRAWNRANGY